MPQERIEQELVEVIVAVPLYSNATVEYLADFVSRPQYFSGSQKNDKGKEVYRHVFLIFKLDQDSKPLQDTRISQGNFQGAIEILVTKYSSGNLSDVDFDYLSNLLGPSVNAKTILQRIKDIFQKRKPTAAPVDANQIGASPEKNRTPNELIFLSKMAEANSLGEMLIAIKWGKVNKLNRYPGSSNSTLEGMESQLEKLIAACAEGPGAASAELSRRTSQITRDMRDRLVFVREPRVPGEYIQVKASPKAAQQPSAAPVVSPGAAPSSPEAAASKAGENEAPAEAFEAFLAELKVYLDSNPNLKGNDLLEEIKKRIRLVKGDSYGRINYFTKKGYPSFMEKSDVITTLDLLRISRDQRSMDERNQINKNIPWSLLGLIDGRVQ